MGRLLHETRETILPLAAVSCLMAGVGGAVYYTIGPDGWLAGLARALLRDPNLATLAALAAAIAALSLAMRILDGNRRSGLNNLLAGAFALGGFAILLQGMRAVLS